MQTSDKIKNDFLNNSIKIEAHISDYEFGQSSTNKSLTSKSFIEELSKQTKNYDRVSQTYFKHSALDFNKDSGIDSNRECMTAIENLYRLRLSSNDSDSNIRNNRKLIKRLIDHKKVKKMKTNLTDSSSIVSIDSMKLKRELKASKDLDSMIKKAIIDLLALDKLEKQKKLNILKQQKVLQLQKMKLQNLKFIKSSLTDLQDAELHHESELKNSFEKIKFPTIVRKYNPYDDLENVYATRALNKEAAKKNDEFYMQNKSLNNFTNDASFDEIMKAINDIETRERLSGNFSNSNYFYNGQIIKGNMLDSTFTDGPKKDRPVEIYELAHEPSLMKSSSSNYVKHSSEILDYFDYHSDYSTFTSVSTIQNKIRNKSKRKLQQSYRDEEDVEMHQQREAFKPLKNRSEFYVVPELKKESFTQKVNNYLKSMLDNKKTEPISEFNSTTEGNVKKKGSTVEIKQKKTSTEFAPKIKNRTVDSFHSASGISEISKIFRDIIDENEVKTKEETVVKQPDVLPDFGRIEIQPTIEENKNQEQVEIKSVLKKSKQKDNRSIIDKLKDKVPSKKKPKAQKKPKISTTKKNEKKPKITENNVKKEKEEITNNDSILSKLFKKASFRSKTNVDTVPNKDKTSVENKENEGKIKISNKENKKIAKQKKAEEDKLLKAKKREEKLKQEDEKKKKILEKKKKIDEKKKVKPVKVVKDKENKKQKPVKTGDNKENNKENLCSRLFSRNKSKKKTHFKDADVKEIVGKRQIHDDDLPGSNDYLRISEISNNDYPPVSIASSTNDIRNSYREDDEPTEYRYDTALSQAPLKKDNFSKFSNSQVRHNPLLKDDDDDEDPIYSRVIKTNSETVNNSNVNPDKNTNQTNKHDDDSNTFYLNMY